MSVPPVSRAVSAGFGGTGGEEGDAGLAELIGELAAGSGDFASLWAEGDVADCTVGRMLLSHPTMGSLDVDYQVWSQPESPDHRLEVYTPNDAPTRNALALLPGTGAPPS